mmetsp:Transcript_20281/g.50180  ORF Transcript_20281/g.50180 Transcript_20281/m.50180 type:complete len:104 (-) Transcript_20281:10-321(-)
MFSASALYVAFCGVFETTNDIRDGEIRLISKSDRTHLLQRDSLPEGPHRPPLCFVLEETTLAALALELPFNGQRVKLASHLRTMKGAERLGQRQRGLFRCACV